jgi:hypothetical protein
LPTQSPVSSPRKSLVVRLGISDCRLNGTFYDDIADTVEGTGYYAGTGTLDF